MKKFLFTVLVMYFLAGIEYHANGNEPMQIVIEEISPESFEALALAVASIGGPTEVELFTPYVYTGYSELGFYSWGVSGGVSITNIQNSGYYYSTATLTFSKVGTFRIGYGDATLFAKADIR